jgi:hypothetical protein
MVSANMHRKDDERPHRQSFDHEKRGITIQAAGGATRKELRSAAALALQSWPQAPNAYPATRRSGGK